MKFFDRKCNLSMLAASNRIQQRKQIIFNNLKKIITVMDFNFIVPIAITAIVASVNDVSIKTD